MAITKGSALVRNEGDQIETKCAPIDSQVQPGSIFEAIAEFETPMEPGHYQFGLQIQFGQYIFGEKVYCDFIVENVNSDLIQDLEMFNKPVIQQS